MLSIAVDADVEKPSNRNKFYYKLCYPITVMSFSELLIAYWLVLYCQPREWNLKSPSCSEICVDILQHLCPLPDLAIMSTPTIHYC